MHRFCKKLPKLLVISGILLLLFLIASYQGNKQEKRRSEELYKKGVILIKTNSLDKASQALQEALALDPSFQAPRLALARLFIAKNNFRPAKEILNSRPLSMSLEAIHLKEVITLLENGPTKFTANLNYWPSNLKIQDERSVILALRGQEDELLGLLRKSTDKTKTQQYITLLANLKNENPGPLKISPSDDTLILGLRNNHLLERINNLNASLRKLESIKEPEKTLEKVSILIDHGFFQMAVNQIDLAPEDTFSIEIQRLRIEALIGLELLTKAEKDLRPLLESDANHPQNIRLLGELYFKQGKNLEAVNAFESLIAHDPGQSTYYIKLINAYQELNYDDKALSLANVALSRFPKDKPIIIKASELLLESSPERSIKLLKKLPTSSKLSLSLSSYRQELMIRALENAGLRNEAIALAKTLPENPYYAKSFQIASEIASGLGDNYLKDEFKKKAKLTSLAYPEVLQAIE